MDDNFKNEIIEKLLSSRIENDSQAQSCIKSTENSKFIKLLPFEELIKALDARGAEYDKHELEESYFPLEDVEACMNNVVTTRPDSRPCPLCGKRSDELKWIIFRSPKWTWEKLMGTSGPMSICPDCGCIVEYTCLIMN